ncbi:hypothetical protein RIR_jg10099.t1 [Rhizophagus irregularis DAOM 181602=DAOM 197198]|nr:hypothetical protein RIR_jg10099.t1 [Rhizophagus irregularis DAOM 181602=DAOM 197198]
MVHLRAKYTGTFLAVPSDFIGIVATPLRSCLSLVSIFSFNHLAISSVIIAKLALRLTTASGITRHLILHLISGVSGIFEVENRSPLPCKAEAGFSKIKIPNKVHQYDILLHTHDNQDGRKTRLIGIVPAHAIILDKVKLKPSSKAKQAIGKHEEIKLKKSTAVRYLLKPGELEGRITDPYWSLRVYKIKQVVIGKNLPQLVLYYLKNEPIKLTAYLIGRNLKRLFKYEELQVIEESDKIEYLLDNFMWKYHNSKFVYFTQIADKMLIKAQEYAEKRNR